MESNEMNDLLKRIDGDLQQIESAHQQVNSVVVSSKVLLDNVGQYVAAISKLQSNLTSFIKEIENRDVLNVETIGQSVKKLGDALDAQSATFKNNIEQLTVAFKSSVDGSIKTLSDDVRTIAEASESVKNSNDSLMASIEDEAANTKKAISTALTTTIQSINNVNGKVQTTSNSITQIQTSLQQQLSTLSSVVSSISAISSTIAKLQSDIQTTNNSLNTLTTRLESINKDFSATSRKQITRFVVSIIVSTTTLVVLVASLLLK